MSDLRSEGYSWCWDTLCEIVKRFPDIECPMSMARSNHVPNPQERTTILDRITFNDSNNIRPLESVIADMRMTISMLETQLNGYKKYTEFHSSLLSPVRRLPNEILGHIFSYACEDGIDVASFIPNGTIWDILSVCLRWYNVAQQTPNLWRKFEILNVDLPETFPENARTLGDSAVLRRTLSCLKNSGSLPLAISGTLECLHAFPLLAFTEIANHCDRWESLHVTGMCIDQICESEMETVIQDGGLGQLRSLTVRRSPHKQSSFRIFKHASALREVTLLEYVKLPGVQEFPWSSIKVLNLSECNMNVTETFSGTLIPIFESMTSLEVLTWNGNFFHEETTQSVLLPSLHTISVIYNKLEEIDEEEVEHGYYVDPPRTLLLFRAPRLTTVRITGDINQLQDLVSIVRISRDCFTQLILQQTSVNFVLAAFKEFSSVQDLTLIGVEGVERDEILKILIHDPNPEMLLLPSLQRLNLPDLEDSSVSLLMNVMRSRSPHTAEQFIAESALTAHLSDVSITGENSNNPAFLKLKDLGQVLGINIETVYKHPVDS